MWNQPHFMYYVDNPNKVPVEIIEQFVPGTLVYGREGTRRIRYEKLDERVRCVEIYAPLHGAWLVESELSRLGLSCSAQAHHGDNIGAWSDENRDDYEAYGRMLT